MRKLSMSKRNNQSVAGDESYAYSNHAGSNTKEGYVLGRRTSRQNQNRSRIRQDITTLGIGRRKQTETVRDMTLNQRMTK